MRTILALLLVLGLTGGVLWWLNKDEDRPIERSAPTNGVNVEGDDSILTTSTSGPQDFATEDSKRGVPQTATFHVIDSQTRNALPGAILISKSQRVLSDAQGNAVIRGQVDASVLISMPGYISKTESLGAAIDAVIEVELMVSAHIKGHIFQREIPVFGATVRFESSEGISSSVALSKSDGSYNVETAAGEGRLIAISQEGLRASRRAVIGTGETLTDMNLDFGATGTVAGTVTKNGNAVAFAQLTVVDSKSQELAQVVSTNANGEFKIPQISIGRFLVQVKTEKISAMVGPFEVQESSTWTIDLPTGKRLSGRVVPAQAQVSIKMSSASWVGPPMSTLTLEDGSFAFDEVPDEWLDIEASSQNGDAAARARPGDSVVLHLDSNEVVISAQSDRGEKLSGGIVVAKSRDSGVTKRFVVSLVNSEASVKLPKGVWGISFEVPNRGSSSVASVNVNGKGLRVLLTLEPSIVITGTVKDAATGLALFHAKVLAEVWGQTPSEHRSFSAETNERGEFQFASIPKGQVRLVAGRENFASQETQMAQSGVWNVSLKAQTGAKSPEQGSQPAQTFEGIGMVLGQNNGTFLAASINRNSPAERAGVQPQDQILTVDGTPVSGQSIESVVNRIRGPAGTVVNIGFRRGAQEFSLAIRRRQINL
jgi:hypothetical protein